MRLIDADALFEVIEKSMAENPHKEKTQRAMHIHEHRYFLTLLTTFPTIQPVSTDTNVGDTISRQAAITALSHMCSEDEKGITVSRANVDSMLRSLPPVQPEITQDQLEEYCKKRCLTVITDDLFYKLTNGSENTATWEWCGEFWEHRSGLEKFKCNCCGGEVILYFGAKYPNFCPYCGRKSIADTGYERKIEDNGYGFMLITKRQV